MFIKIVHLLVSKYFVTKKNKTLFWYYNYCSEHTNMDTTHFNIIITHLKIHFFFFVINKHLAINKNSQIDITIIQIEFVIYIIGIYRLLNNYFKFTAQTFQKLKTRISLS